MYTRQAAAATQSVQMEHRRVKALDIHELMAAKRAAQVNVNPRGVVQRPNGNKYNLTTREIEVINMLVEESGGNRDIAKRFNISEETVKRHLSNVFDKLGVSTRLELVSKWMYDQQENTTLVKTLRQKIATLEATLEQQTTALESTLKERNKEITMLRTQLSFADRCLDKIKNGAST